MMTRLDLINEAKSWLNTPYHHNARLKGIGVDCGQFLAGVFANCKLIPNLDFGHYTNDWYLHRDEDKYLGYIQKYFKRIKKTELLAGDVILFSYGRTVSHSGIYMGDDMFIHSYVNVGVIYSTLNNLEFTKRYHSSWRLKQWAV